VQVCYYDTLGVYRDMRSAYRATCSAAPAALRKAFPGRLLTELEQMGDTGWPNKALKTELAKCSKRRVPPAPERFLGKHPASLSWGFLLVLCFLAGTAIVWSNKQALFTVVTF
jgi:hypothetical protein